MTNQSAEQDRLSEDKSGQTNWRRWGPYVSERQWGTVREDYSPDGTAWEYFPHDHARSRAYRWGEDGLAGLSDDSQRLCLALALWNGRDPILKERLFGLTNSEGNHGEDAKELYYYLDATPTHSYLKMLYKYPQREFPYDQLVEENRRRGKDASEFELLDTGIFDDDRYFDVFVEYAKAGPEDILMLVTVHNRGPEAASVHLLPQLWFRNTWSWKNGVKKPRLSLAEDRSIVAAHEELGEYRCFFESVSDDLPHPSPLPGAADEVSAKDETPPGRGEGGRAPELIFCDNETNVRRLGDQPDTPGFFKDAFHEYVIAGNKSALNPEQTGTKAAAHYTLLVPAQGSREVRLRLVAQALPPAGSGEFPDARVPPRKNTELEYGFSARTALPLLVRNERGEGRGEGKPTADTPALLQAENPSSPRPSPPSAGGEGEKSGARNTHALESYVNPQIEKSALPPFSDFDRVLEQRRCEADEFYAGLQRDMTDADARQVQRQAFAGMIWSRQFYYYDVPEWLRGDPALPPPPPERRHGRNSEWMHVNNADLISMPDKWEYPWYAAWDLAFHCIPLAMVDAEFAKSQLVLLTREWYMHPNGQLPAYEWALGDVNPPVHAWATWRVFQIDRQQRRERKARDAGDLAFLERVFHKLMLNFTWWVNRKDGQGRNIFQGGFLGLDNIGVFDRSAALPTGGYLNQADGTSWMAMYCLNLMRMALELAHHNHVYEDIATKFFEHFLSIAAAINTEEEGVGLWDGVDEFYYDELRTPGGREIALKVRSMVGLIPLFAVEVLEPDVLQCLPDFAGRLEWFLNYRPDLASLVSRWHEPGLGERRLLSLLRGHRMKCLLRRMLDETEFLSEFGVRALSKVHEREPYRFICQGAELEVRYWPAESRNSLFGGNSNWRGPIWMPVNFLLVESLQKFHHYYGDDFKIECPTGSGRFLTIEGVANELSRRLTRLFLRDETGQRPVLKYHPKLSSDPHFRDYVLFHEYFHGDTGRGVGASHQTGWTGLVAKLLQPRGGEMKKAAQTGDNTGPRSK